MRIPPKLKVLIGTILCAAVAVVVAVMGQSKPGKSILPIWFLAAVMLVIFRFGALAGILGTVVSGIIFAVYLFEPLGRFAVHDEVQKNNLMWMVLVGLALSIFGHPPEKKSASSKEDAQE